MISVILATKNGQRFIDRAIESVLSQTERDLELIVISDASNDATVPKVKAWQAKDSRVKLIDLYMNIGPGLARDKGIKEAQGEYIAFIDDDDYWISKDKLASQRKFLDEYKKHVLVGITKTKIVDENNNVIRYYNNPKTDSEIRRVFLLKNSFITSSVLFRKEAYLSCGGFKPMYLAEDYDLWLRMGKIGKIANLDGVEIAYTLNPSGASKKRRKDLYRATLTIVKQNRKSYPNFWIGLLKAYARIALFHLNLI